MQTGRRGELFAYLVIIAVNLLVLPNWFSPGRFPFGTRLGFIVVSAAIITFCAWRVTGILGVSPFSKRKRPTFTPYRPAPGEDDAEHRADSRALDAPIEREPIEREPIERAPIEREPIEREPIEREPPGPSRS